MVAAHARPIMCQRNDPDSVKKLKNNTCVNTANKLSCIKSENVWIFLLNYQSTTSGLKFLFLKWF